MKRAFKKKNLISSASYFCWREWVVTGKKQVLEGAGVGGAWDRTQDFMCTRHTLHPLSCIPSTRTFLFFFFFWWTEVWAQGFLLAKQGYSTWTTPPVQKPRPPCDNEKLLVLPGELSFSIQIWVLGNTSYSYPYPDDYKYQTTTFR
jgi:hypothetical protein